MRNLCCVCTLRCGFVLSVRPRERASIKFKSAKLSPLSQKRQITDTLFITQMVRYLIASAQYYYGTVLRTSVSGDNLGGAIIAALTNILYRMELGSLYMVESDFLNEQRWRGWAISFILRGGVSIVDYPRVMSEERCMTNFLPHGHTI